MYRVLFAGIAAILLAAPVTASADADRGFAVAGGIGSSVIRDEDGAETFRGTAFGASFDIEYRINPHLAVGFGLFDLGTAEDTFESVDTEIDVRGFGLFARLVLPVSDAVDVYGRLGNVSYSADLEPGGNNGLFGSEAWVLGGGVDFRTTEQLAFRIEGRYYDGRRDESGGLVTIGLAYRF